MMSKVSNRYKEYLESDWYKNHLAKGIKTVTDKRKKRDFKKREFHKIQRYLDYNHK